MDNFENSIFHMAGINTNSGDFPVSLAVPAMLLYFCLFQLVNQSGL